MTEIYDCNLHSPRRQGWDLREWEAFRNDEELKSFTRGNVIHFSDDPFPLRHFCELVSDDARFRVVAALDPKEKRIEALTEEAIFAGCVGIKLHPRRFQHNLDHPGVEKLIRVAQTHRLPVLICSFPDGSWGRLRLELEDFAKLADAHPDLNFVWMHSGGHKIIDAVFLAKRRPNVILDLSFLVNYFPFGPVADAISFAIWSMRGRRMIFGSDYPEFSTTSAMNALRGHLQRIPNDKVELVDVESVVYRTAVSLFTPSESFGA